MEPHPAFTHLALGPGEGKVSLYALRLMGIRAGMGGCFDLDVELMPEFEPTDIAAIELTRPVYEATDAEVDESLKELAASNRTYEPKKGKTPKEFFGAYARLSARLRVVQRRRERAVIADLALAYSRLHDGWCVCGMYNTLSLCGRVLTNVCAM